MMVALDNRLDDLGCGVPYSKSQDVMDVSYLTIVYFI